MSAMAQPTAISTTGVRHDWSFTGVDAVAVDMGGPGDAAAGFGAMANRILRHSAEPAKAKVRDDFDLRGIWLHGWAAKEG
jgi:hypothetical protein